MSRNTSRIETDSRAAPSGSEPTVTLGALKDLLHRFTWERREWDREKAAAEFGALVLYVIQQADRLDIDLVSAGETHMLKLAGSQPQLVQTKKD